MTKAIPRPLLVPMSDVWRLKPTIFLFLHILYMRQYDTAMVANGFVVCTSRTPPFWVRIPSNKRCTNHECTQPKRRFGDMIITNGYNGKQFTLTAKSNKGQGGSSEAAALGFGSSTSTTRGKRSIQKSDTTAPMNVESISSQGKIRSGGKQEEVIIKLDKWGLPPPTIEDIFPIVSKESTDITPINGTTVYSTNDIQTYLQDFYPNQMNWKYVSLHSKDENGDPQSLKDSSMSAVNNTAMKLQLLHVAPPVIQIDHFLTERECYDVQRIVTDCTNDNVVCVASKTISSHALSKRTSTSWFCSYTCIPTVLAKLRHVLGIQDLYNIKPDKSLRGIMMRYQNKIVTMVDNGSQLS
jgi:hypothetical protein